MNELYRKHRPTSFKDMFGQKDAMKTLNDMGKRGVIPHTMLFVGPSGTGKTTVARILRKKLKCSDNDFTEINASDDRGIDTIRAIRKSCPLAPLDGDCRIYMIDECHALTPDAQNSFLKLLEDPPSHVYFFLCTTDPQKLKKTIITRSTEVKFKLLTGGELSELIESVCEKEDASLDGEVIAKMAIASEGSARKALVILHAIIGLGSVKDQLSAIESASVTHQSIEIARALFSGKDWKTVAGILKTIDEDPESIRYMVLGYARSVLLKSGSSTAALIIEEFRESFMYCKAAGLAVACWNVIKDS